MSIIIEKRFSACDIDGSFRCFCCPLLVSFLVRSKNVCDKYCDSCREKLFDGNVCALSCEEKMFSTSFHKLHNFYSATWSGDKKRRQNNALEERLSCVRSMPASRKNHKFQFDNLLLIFFLFLLWFMWHNDDVVTATEIVWGFRTKDRFRGWIERHKSNLIEERF